MDTVTAFQVIAHEASRTPFEAQATAGRWTGEGRAVIYASCTASTALLEFLAHRDSSLPDALACARMTLRPADVDVLDRLPDGWRERPYRPDVQALGDRWLHERRSVALRVPSVLAPASHNLLINPSHPAFRGLAVDFTEAFRLDSRLA